MIDLSSLDQFKEKKFKPTELDFIFYVFWDKGISLAEFEELPIPYILSIIQTNNYIKEKEIKELEKSKKKKSNLM